MKLTQSQLQAIVIMGVFGVKAKIHNIVANNLLHRNLIEYDNDCEGLFLSDEGRKIFCYLIVEAGMDPYGDDLPDYVKDEIYSTIDRSLI